MVYTPAARAVAPPTATTSLFWSVSIAFIPPATRQKKNIDIQVTPQNFFNKKKHKSSSSLHMEQIPSKFEQCNALLHNLNGEIVTNLLTSDNLSDGVHCI